MPATDRLVCFHHAEGRRTRSSTPPVAFRMEQHRTLIAYLIIAAVVAGVVGFAILRWMRVREKQRFGSSGYTSNRPWWSRR